MIYATVLTDASYNQHRRSGGWAAWVKIDNYDGTVKGFGSLVSARNSAEAEAQAALNGIYLAAKWGATDILVRSDCMAVIHLIRGQATKDYLIRLWTDYLTSDVFQNVSSVRGKHVKAHINPNRHAAGWVNNWCDTHAKEGRKQLEKGRPFRELDGKRVAL